MNTSRIILTIALGVTSVALLIATALLRDATAQKDKMYKILVSSCEVTGNLRSDCEKIVDNILNYTDAEIDEFNSSMRRK